MKPNDLPEHLAPATPPAASPEIFHRLGSLTRQLHDTLNQLGVMPKLQDTVQCIPDARDRLNFIAQKTGEAAERVLNLVEEAKHEHSLIAEETRHIAASVVKDPVRAVASGQVMNFVHAIEARTTKVDQHLTDIMMAQDYHDLTGQVISKVLRLANDLETQLLEMLLISAPDHVPRLDSSLQGPAVNTEGRTDVVSNQSEVDDLLASMGF